MFRKNKTVKSVLLGLGIVIIAFSLFIKRSGDIEEFCRQQAEQIAGDRWNTMLEPTPDEYGYLLPQGGKPQNHKIALGFREQIKCERGEKFFYFF